MIRKQFYLSEDQHEKLQRLAKARGCSEAQVIRAALDALPDPSGALVDRLRAVGVLLPEHHDPDLPQGDKAEGMRQELEEWLATQTDPLGLSEAVIEDRR